MYVYIGIYLNTYNVYAYISKYKCRLLDVPREEQPLPNETRRALLRAVELHQRCCEQERLQELVHQGLRLQRVAVCLSLLQRFAACCHSLQCVATCWSMLQFVAVYCSVLHQHFCEQECLQERVHLGFRMQRVEACCSVLQCVAPALF